MLDLDGPAERARRVFAARPGTRAAWPDWVAGDVRDALRSRDIEQPWRHQVEAAEALHAGRSVALTTGTASGKSLGYLLPVLDATRGAEAGTALYLAPTKALAHDQLRAGRALGLAGWRLGALDGDSEPDDRLFARDHATYLVSNPDMLHRSVLPSHPQWARFLAGLRLVVVDEAHRYRGAFGSHVAAVLRRLRRLAAHHGADPAVAVVSATTVDGAALAAGLAGVERPLVVADDASARGPVTVTLRQPEGWAEDDAAALLAAAVGQRRQAVAFVTSRRAAETVARRARGLAGGTTAIASYRSGYLAAERRQLERALQTREVLGVAATNALELGVDLGGVEVVVVAGFPGSRASFWQQAGRAGRLGQPAEVVLVAGPAPLDAYLLDHPEALLDAPVEACPVRPDNPYVLAPHLAAAAQELPLTAADERFFGPTMPDLLAGLADAGVVRRRASGWYWVHADRAVDGIDLRTSSGPAVDVVDPATGRVLGHVDEASALSSLHPGAVYLHQGETYLCDTLDLESGEALVHPARPGYLTQPRVDVATRVVAEHGRRQLGGGTVHHGEVEVTTRVTGYLRRDEVTGDVWDSTPLDLPARRLRAEAVWWSLGSGSLEGALDAEALDRGLHALEHVAAGLLPVFAGCDRFDLTASSVLRHPDVDGPTVVVHESQPGGLGFTRRAFEAAEEWLVATADRLAHCACSTGCPACTLSARCGTPARGLDKAAAGALAAAAGRRSEPPLVA